VVSLVPMGVNNLFFVSKKLFAGIDALARRRLMSIVLVFFLSFGGSWLLSVFRGIPIPWIHDEFSYLLAGDTFAHGRVTNPTHPMWIYFETFHVLQRPTYMSMFPPGQGIFLAIGQVLFGHPIYGVWLSAGLMCAAICWMLYAWVTPRWALIGGLVAVLQFGVFTYWSQSYWGGAVAGIGGALVFGALPRIFKTQRIRDALWLGLGCAILANSRPLEGFLVAIPVGCLVLPWKIRWKELMSVKFITRIILPLGIILSVTVMGMGAYNKQITGDAKVFPHFLYDNTYSSAPVFIFQPLRPPLHFNHKTMEIFEQYRTEKHYIEKRAWPGLVNSMEEDSFRMVAFFFGYPLAIPSLFILLLFFRHPQAAMRFGLAFLFILGVWAISFTYVLPHYFSPLTCLFILLITIGLRGLYWLKSYNKQAGSVFVIFLIAFQLFLNLTLTPNPRVVPSLARTIQRTSINLPPSFTREELKNILMKRGGKYLVIVKYPSWHNYQLEWVFNDADIDQAPIVWARDMDEGNDKRLLDYFKDREVLFIQINWDKRRGALSYDARQ
jgi:hypothetical protein